MRRNNILKSTFAVILSIMLLLGISFPYYAYYAPNDKDGVNATGVMIVDEDSPIVVEKEVLTFDISEFPSRDYQDMTEYLAYSGKVTTEYTFYNPSEYTVTNTVLLPYGKLSDYAVYYDERQYVYDADSDKYTIMIDGQTVESTVRHTLAFNFDQFDIEKDLPRVIDGYMTHSFYSPDLPVYRLTYKVTGLTHKARVATEWSGDSTKTKIMLEKSGGSALRENSVELSSWNVNDSEFHVYIFGEYQEPSNWTVYRGAGKDVVPGNVELASVEKMTLKEYLMTWYEPGILEWDWYNAVVHKLIENEWHYGLIFPIHGEWLMGKHLLHWYEYEITLEPGQRIVNTVTAPMYPGISLKYEPNVYMYTYLLSTTKTWSEYGTLDIILNTPYYLTESTISGYEKTDTGYQWRLSGFPEDELAFSLSTDVNPQLKDTTIHINMTEINKFFYGGIAIIGLVGASILFGVFLNARRKNVKDKRT